MRAPSKSTLIWRSSLAALLFCGAGLVQAQTADTSGDPPDRVARLSYMEGDVGLLPSGAQDWGAAGINRPLTSGDKLSSAAGGRAELELDGAALRLDAQTDVGFLQLDDQMAQLELTQGTLNLAVRQLDDGQSYEIDTPTVALVVDHPGNYRVDVDADGQATRVTAFDGSATVYGENDAQRTVVAGRSYRFTDSSLAGVELEDIEGGDDFDAWCDQRDRRYADSSSRHYVSEDVIGYQDLDRYGDWRSDPDYGQVWYPAHVDADWAPYRNGHWAWVGPWGWTWVDDAPWGFAPYHYGRWAWRHDGWCWVPGPIGWRPVYAPALVAFVGGAHWSVSIGERPVGWFPLGPGEVYDPWYRGSRRYYTRINVTNIHVHRGTRVVIADRIDHRYNDWHRGIAPPVRALHGKRPRGFTAMPGRNFADADRVQRHRLKVDPDAFAHAAVLTRGATPRPTPHSFAPRRPAQARTLPERGFSREVVARHAPRMGFAHAGGTGHTPPHAARSQVLVLRPHAGTLPAVAHLMPSDHAHTAQQAPRAPARFDNRRDDRAGPDRTAPTEAQLRQGELRSSRFVHAREPAGAPRERQQPRPGVSFISSDRADRAHAAARLPQVPHIERAGADHAPPAQSRPEPNARWRRAVDLDAQARTARIEDARRQQATQRQPERRREGNIRPVQPAHLRAPDFDAQLHARPTPPPPRFSRPPDFRSLRPMPQAAPAQRPPAPPPVQARPAQSHAPAAQPRHEGGRRRFDQQH
jgi:hypothetical protein